MSTLLLGVAALHDSYSYKTGSYSYEPGSYSYDAPFLPLADRAPLPGPKPLLSKGCGSSLIVPAGTAPGSLRRCVVCERVSTLD
jgi:hypothetical protein